MIGLSLRLAVAGGREAAVRLAVLAAGIALAVTLLCFAAAVSAAVQARDARVAWQRGGGMSSRPAVGEGGGLLIRVAVDHHEGHEIVRADVAVTGLDAPGIPGFGRLPGPGQAVVSPALADLLARSPADQLADRLPGPVVGTIGAGALGDDGQLVVAVGHEPAELRTWPLVREVRTAADLGGSRQMPSWLRLALPVGAIGLLVPVLVFVAASTRLGAARRRQRFSALRRAGATGRQTAVVAAVEAVLTAVPGTLAGGLAFLALRPVAAGIPLDGATFRPADLTPVPGLVLAVAVGVPMVAALGAVASVRSNRPRRPARRLLTGGRRRSGSRPGPLRLVPLAAGLGALAVVLATVRLADRSDPAVLAPFALVTVGVVIVGPLLARLGAAVLVRYSRRASTLVAARRLADDPVRAFRPVAGVVVAVFVVTVFNGLVPASVADADSVASRSNHRLLAADLASRDTAAAVVDAERLVADLAAVRGVERVVTARSVPGGSSRAACADLVALSVPDVCPDAVGYGHAFPDVIVPRSFRQGFGPPVALDPAAFARLPVSGVLVRGDGDPATIERVRTAILRAGPQVRVATGADVDLQRSHTTRRVRDLSAVGLVLAFLTGGCSLAAGLAGGLVDRRRPFALLRRAGLRVGELRRIVLIETAVPLLVGTAGAAAAGVVTSGLLTGRGRPPASFLLVLAGGLAGAGAIVVATLPLVDRLTHPATVRFE